MGIIGNDPFGNIRGDKGDPNPSPQEVRAFHTKSDVDATTTSHHHTLGTRRTQSAYGDHTHDGITSRQIGEGEGFVLTGAKGGNVALANLITMLSEWIDFTDSTT